ncbi:MAG: glycine cleavage system aminomethyltransferase GcvT [Phycisphaerales bacterium]
MLRTPLHAFHARSGAQFVDFAGWEMPIMYKKNGVGSLVDEHKQVRSSGGIFDVSHMGRFRVNGIHAGRLLDRLCTRRIREMKPGVCRYSLVCNPAGGIMDDVIVYRIDEDDFTVVVNASNREKLWKHFNAAKEQGALKVNLDDQTAKTAMVAIQGPKVIEFIGKFSREIPTLKRYTFAVKNLMVIKLVVSRTGYTGEDGVEVILPAMMIDMAMKLLLKDINLEAPDALIKPAGLGARDTLRLEAGMPLYGHELTEETNPLATGLDFAIAIDKDQDERGEAFIGSEALKKSRDSGGPTQKLIGLALPGPRAARQGMTIMSGGTAVGLVTSGGPSPTLGYPIAMGYVKKDFAAPDTQLQIDTGGKGILDAKVVPIPFYKAPKKA